MTRRTLLAGAAFEQQTLRLPRKIRLGMIGLEGHIGEILTPLKLLPDVEIVAACDADERAMGRLKRVPNAAQIRFYKDYRQLLAREKPDMAAVGGPNGSRAAIILACAERKLHVVAEKPLAIERPDLERIRRAVAANGIRLTMLLPMRFSPAYLAMRQIVAAGEIGEVAQMGAQKSYKLGERPEWMRHRASFGGTIPYIGVHMIDLMRFIGGRDMVEVAAFQNRIGFPELGDMENTTSTIFRLDNGGTAALRMDYLRPETAPTHGDDRLRLAGTGGVLEFQAATGVTLITRKEKPRTITALPAGRSLFVDFLESVYQGKSHALPLADIYRVNEIVLAAREAAERRQVVRV
ncbi:MAG: Gfo/Idh/MocA family oxidoreductase [Acidobacteria bacterium]|nr:Gfo/Idh/MocA family oxidoreductase [Acidobacteriota bacterium]